MIPKLTTAIAGKEVTVFHAAVTSGETLVHSTKHRTQRAAARSLSRAIRQALSYPNVMCGVVADDGTVVPLRTAQGKSDALVDAVVAVQLRNAVGLA